MNYRLNRQGVDLGAFTLEELRRRRQSGELSGTEYVLADGAAEWRLLDVILQQGGSMPAASAAGAKKSGNKWIWIVVAVAGCLVLIMAAAGLFIGYRFLKAVQKGATIFPTQVTTSVISSSYDPTVEASKPVAIGAKTQTETTARERARKFRVRQWLEGYEQRGRRDEPCDKEALQLLEAWMAKNYGSSDKTNLPDLGLLLKKLGGERDCNDPLILTIIAVETSDAREKMRRLDQALAGFDQSHHRGYPKFYAAVMLAGEWANNPKKVAELDHKALRYLGEMFKDGSILPEDQPEIGEILINGWGAKFFSRNQGLIFGIAPPEKSFEWLRLVLEGEYHINEAWRLRGSGYADKVTQQGWQGFANELSTARRCLTKAYDLQPTFPLAPARMITVSLGDSSMVEMRQWFDRTTAIQIDYPSAWSGIRWGLRPRWGGSLEAMLAFGATAVNTGRFDTDVPRKLFDSVTDLESELKLPVGEHIYGREDVWPLLKKMYEGYIAEPSELPTRQGWQSTYAAIAFLAGQYDVARTQFDAMDWKPWTNNFKGYGVDLSLMPLEVAARTGPAGPAVRRAEAARTDGDTKTALTIYEGLSKTNTDARTGEFIAVRLASLGAAQRLGSGGWIDFLPSGEKDPGWVFVDGTVRVATNGLLEVEPGPEGHFIYSRVAFATGFEIKGDIEIVPSSAADFQAGVIMGLAEPKGKNWLGFRIKRSAEEGDIASYSRGWTRGGTTQPIKFKDGQNSFSFRLENGVATATVNGEEVFRNAPLPAKINVPEGQFVLGIGAYRDKGGTVIRYRNVQVRRL